MPGGRSTGEQWVCHYKGPNTQEDFLVFVDDKDEMVKWREDKTIPPAQFMFSKKGQAIKVTHKQGEQGGQPDNASKATLESEFGTVSEDDIIAKILQDGDCKPHENKGRSGDTNASKGGSVAH